MIVLPKIFHYVWLGKQSMHPLMIDWQKKWKTLHPNWTIKVWKEIEDLPPHFLTADNQLIECRHPEYLSQCPTYAKRSDVWRYEILEQLGGVYLDTDFEPVKNLDPLLENVPAFAGLCDTRYGWSRTCPLGKIKTEVGCSIMGTVPHHPWIHQLMEETPLQDPIEQLSLAFPYLTRITSHHPDVTLFNQDVFYPVTWDQYARSSRSLLKLPLPDTTYAVHRWSSTWYAEGLRPRT